MKSDNSIRHRGLRLLATVITGLSAWAIVAVPSAHARGTGALLGNPAGGSSSDCFSGYGGVVNNCASTEHWSVMAPLDGDGWKNFYIRARGVNTTARKVGCKAYSSNADLSVLNFSSLVETSKHTGEVELLQMSVNVPGWGSNYAYCSMDEGTAIFNMHYDS